VHMPSHAYVRTGRWSDALEASKIGANWLELNTPLPPSPRRLATAHLTKSDTVIPRSAAILATRSFTLWLTRISTGNLLKKKKGPERRALGG